MSELRNFLECFGNERVRQGGDKSSQRNALVPSDNLCVHVGGEEEEGGRGGGLEKQF